MISHVFFYCIAEHIIKKLELLSVQLRGPYEWVFTSLMDTGIPLPKVFEVYNKYVLELREVLLNTTLHH